MKIALIGATGFVGSTILQEAINRGHAVTAITRSPQKLPRNDHIRPSKADVNDLQTLTKYFQGQDAVIHAYAPARDLSVQERIDRQRTATQTIIAAIKSTGVSRILAVGGAGTLEVSPGICNMDRPEFPAAWEGGAKSTAVIKELLLAEPDLEWTYLCPSHNLFPGERTGKFRLGHDQMLIGADGESRISVQDYAVAMVDELENPKHTRRRFTVGY